MAIFTELSSIGFNAINYENRPYVTNAARKLRCGSWRGHGKAKSGRSSIDARRNYLWEIIGARMQVTGTFTSADVQVVIAQQRLKTKDVPEVDLHSTYLRGAVLNDGSFEGANIDFADLRDVKMSHGKFE